MCAAATQVIVQADLNFTAARSRIGFEERARRDQDAGQAVAALGRVVLEQRLLKRMQRFIRKPFQSDQRHPFEFARRAPFPIGPGGRHGTNRERIGR